jgi:hypothetical protein
VYTNPSEDVTLVLPADAAVEYTTSSPHPRFQACQMIPCLISSGASWLKGVEPMPLVRWEYASLLTPLSLSAAAAAAAAAAVWQQCRGVALCWTISLQRCAETVQQQQHQQQHQQQLAWHV